MTAASSGQPSLEPQKRRAPAETVPRPPRPRWTRGLAGMTRRLTQSEKASLAWRIIAGGTRPGEAHGLLRGWVAGNSSPGFYGRCARFPVRLTDCCASESGLIWVKWWCCLPDATAVEPGAIVGELHCNNRTILELVRHGGNPFAACRDDLKSLSNWIQQDRLARQIVIGIET
jgi:hypothetical protein